MKVLFVASGNKKGAGVVSSFVQSQYDSLKAEGLDLYGADTESIRKDAAQRADALIEEILSEEE